MNCASTVYIARHGERIDHVNPDWLDTAESPHDPFLTEKGIKQARALGRFLKSQGGLDYIFASPFYRTVQTANEVAKETGVKIRVEPGMGEFLNPDWFDEDPKLKPIEELKAEFETIDDSYKPQVACSYPEQREDVIVRAGVTARLLAAKYSGRVLMVGHGITCEFMARGLSSVGVRPYISYCSLQTCHVKDKQGGLYDVEDEVRVDFMDEAIKPIVKENWYN